MEPVTASVALQLWGERPEPAVLLADAAAAMAVLEERARSYEARSKAANTWRAYASDLRHFGAWCAARDLAAMPAAPATLRAYLVDHAEALAVSTLRRRLSAISEAHSAAGAANPTTAPEVRFAWEGMRRAHGRAPAAKAAAVTATITALLAPLAAGPGASLIDVRDRAVVLVGFAAALRRSELAALAVGDVVQTAEGLEVHVRRSKTDQEGAGATIGVAYGAHPLTCPVRAWRAWAQRLQNSNITEGPALRALRHGYLTDQPLSGAGIARMLKRRAAAAGLDPAQLSGHSLRSGFATTAARAGVAEHKIMRQGRWRTSAAMRGYIHTGEPFTDNPSAQLGL